MLSVIFYKFKVEKFRHVYSAHSPREDECTFVTETLGDILEANAVLIPAIAVDFEYHDREILSKGRPFQIVSNAQKLFDSEK